MTKTTKTQIEASSNASKAAPALAVESRSIDSLKPYPRNPRTHSKKQVRQIANSLREFGFNNPVLLDDDDVIIAGHGRVEAAKLLGWDSVPSIRLRHLTEAQKRAYILADNKIAEKAGWDQELLSIELQNLIDLDPDFSITTTGFEVPEVDGLLHFAEGSDDEEPVDEMPPEMDDDRPVVSEIGDLWKLGRHRLLCADARNPLSYDRLCDGEKAQMVITDPPYNVAINGHVCGLGVVRHEEFVMASGEMTKPEFKAFLDIVFTNLAASSKNGAIHFVFSDWRHMEEFLFAGYSAYTEMKNFIVWCKARAGMGSFYRSQHECVFVFKNGRGRHINNFELGQHARYRTNVWHYPGDASSRAGEQTPAEHPTIKPVAMIADAMLDCSEPNGLVLDAFSGSGTIFLAAERVGRRAYALELHPRYVDVAVRRWQDVTGEEAIHAETGETFFERATRLEEDPTDEEQ